MAPLLASGELLATEVARAMVERIEAVNPALNAYVYFDPERVLADAAALDARRAASMASGDPLPPLHGVPYSIKCLTEVEGLPATSALKPFADKVGQRDSILVSRLKQAGGLFLGLTNAPEGGYYGGTDGHLYGATHNPWKHGHTAGGSSGGAAAAVASGLGPLADGSDGAGSIRIPSAMCGVVGFKPALGRIPLGGSGSRTMTIVYHGPITRTVADAALMLETMAGLDPRDPLSLATEPPGTYTSAVGRDIAGWRVAYSPDLGLGYVDPEVAEIVRTAAGAFEELGATVTEATPGWANPERAMWEGGWVPLYSGRASAADWDSFKGEVDDNFIELMHQGTALTVDQAARGEAARGVMYGVFTEFMADYDILVSPTLASAAFPLGQFAPSWLDGESLQRQLLGWLLTYPYNMLTNPAITVPAGFTSDGRPVGLQIAGRFRADATVLQAAASYERARPWHDAKPVIVG